MTFLPTVQPPQGLKDRSGRRPVRRATAMALVALAAALLVPQPGRAQAAAAAPAAATAPSGGPAAKDGVLLHMGLLPGVHRRQVQSVEATQTIQVLEDRGIVERARQQGGQFPVVLRMRNDRTTRMQTGAREADGQYPLLIAFEAVSQALLRPDGSAVPVPQPLPMEGLQMRARADRQDHLLPDSLELAATQPGATDEQLQQLKTMVAALFGQISQLPAVQVRPGEPSTLKTRLQMPVPGAGPLELGLNIVFTLRALNAGVADVDLQMSITLEQASAPLKVSASGFGAGTMRYDVAARRSEVEEQRLMINLEVDGPEGKIGIQSQTVTRQRTEELPPAAAVQPAAAASR